MNAGLLLALAMVADPAPMDEVLVSEPPVVALAMRQASSGAVAGVGISELLRGFDGALAAQSSLRRARLPEDWASSCLEQPGGLYRCVLAIAAPRDREAPDVVMILSFAEVDGRPQVGLRAFRVDEALAAPREAGEDGQDPWPVLRARRQIAAGGAEETFAGIFTEELAPLFEGFPQRGRLEIEAPRSGAKIFVDGREVTASAGPRVALEGLEVGAHTVRFEHPALRSAETELSITAGARAHWHPSAAYLTTARWRRGILWTGVGLVGVGAAVAASSLAFDSQGVCSAAPGVSCPSWRFARTGGEPGIDGGESGVPLLPVGYSVAAIGATWALGTVLTSREDELPWIAVVAGVVVGAVTLGVSLAAEPGLR